MIHYQGILLLASMYSFSVLVLGVLITVGLFLFHVVVIPLLVKYSKTFRRGLVFANFVLWPRDVNYEQPQVDGGRNFSIEYHSKVDKCRIKIGIWHILPKSAYERLKGKFNDNTDKEELNRLLNEELANSKSPIMMYCHTKLTSRASPHRIELYKFFQRMDFHTIAFDYRGYGDSTNVHPTENGVVEDALVVYEWLHNTIDKGQERPPVFIWGHSLGAGISSHMLGELDILCGELLERGSPLPLPNGLILEAPFNNLADEIAEHPLSMLMTWLPYYDATIMSPFRSETEHQFRSDEHLSRAPSLPILILHGKDDLMVPFQVGLKLHQFLLATRAEGDAPVTLHTYEKSEMIYFKGICNATNLGDIVGDFVKKHR